MQLQAEAKSNLVPHFVEASSLALLQERMLELNLTHGKQIEYRQVFQKQDGAFVAWYYFELDVFPRIKNAKMK